MSVNVNPRCSGTTRSGTPCRYFAHPGQTTCAFHDGSGIPTIRTCPTCRVRWQAKVPGELLEPVMRMHPSVYSWLERAALVSMEMCDVCSEAPYLHPEQTGHEWVGRPLTPAEFVWWIKTDVLGKNEAAA